MPDGGVATRQKDTVLVVDDSRAQRRLMSTYLKRWGYRVLEADGGIAAMDICRTEDPDLVLSDWMMPGMDGIDFCREYRALQKDSYGYFILLTSKSDKGDIAQGLEIGADDFLTKPVNSVELRARLRAGMRVVRMEQELKEKNRLVSATLAEMQVLHDAIDRDLIEARQLQQSLVRERHRKFLGADVSLMLHPAGHVGGDLVGFFAVNETEIGVYAIDVSGHGIASALMTARLAGFFSGNSPRGNIALGRNSDGSLRMRDPSDVVRRLNNLVMNEMETEHYLTLLLCKCDLKTGSFQMTHAGHPHPVVQRSDGHIEFLGDGGMPVGLIPDAGYSQFGFQLNPGDRLFLGSDGITECADPDGNMLDSRGLETILKKNSNLSGEAHLEAMMWDLTTFSGDSDFDDDVSAVLLEFNRQDGQSDE